MNTEMIVRAWKDPEFRASLSAEQRALLPDSPSGTSVGDLDELALGDTLGGNQCKALRNYCSSGNPDCTFINTGCNTQCFL